ncbi:MAG: DUF4349 domain-containing protein [Planctomycetota bacterium]
MSEAEKRATLDRLASVPSAFVEQGWTVSNEPRSLSPSGRAIVRRATIELRVADVRGAYEAAIAMLEPGEFVENSRVSGQRGDMVASATLRITATRLDDVLAGLRRLPGVAAVEREDRSASDATDVLTDLEARLRNEERIEAELLELLANRAEAPLADVLRVREALGEVRLDIERLEAQCAATTARVALATLRGEIQRVQAEPDASSGGAGKTSFLVSMREALARGGGTLADSAAWIVEVFVGGLLAWLGLAAVGVWVYRTLRWRATWS